MSETYVIKRDGRREKLDLEKIHRVIKWACEGLSGVSVSQVEMKSHLQFTDGMKTEDIHEIIIKASADLISVENPNYQYLSARLAIFHLRKKAFGMFTPPTVGEHAKKMTSLGVYDKHILEDYTFEEFAEMDKFIDHNRDMDFSYAAVKQLEGKYFCKNRVTNKIYESPQLLYLFIGACLFSKYPKESRMSYVKKFYDAVSTFRISLPTPIMAGVRTPTRQFSSCVLLNCGDSLDSIKAVNNAIIDYVSRRAGIGINAGEIRAIGSEIRKGEASHTGLIPFYKNFETSVHSCSQGGVRKGSATIFYPIWHYEFEDLIVLKNNKGTEDNRVRHMDYGVQLNRLFYDRFLNNEEITLFSPSDVEGLYGAFFQDQDKFEELYLKYEAMAEKGEIRHKKISAFEVFTSLCVERINTGRIYIMHVDHANENGGFIQEIAPVTQSNLCMEILLPTKPLSLENNDGRIALCTLAGFNLGVIEDFSEFEELSDIIVRALDALLDYQDYPMYEAKQETMDRRTLGVGLINFANFLAKNGVKYSDGSANNLVFEMSEAFQYYLLKASNELAKEKGACPKFNETKYSKGLMPVDRYKKSIDDIHTQELKQDWDSLRDSIVKHGLRNSTLSALMPSECQSKSNLMKMEDGSNKTLGEILEDGLVNVEAIEFSGIPQRVPIKPTTLFGGREVTDVYYNGLYTLFEVKFEDEDETYKFTGNHQLLVTRMGTEFFETIVDLEEGDWIVCGNIEKKIEYIEKVGKEHTWDVSTIDEQYVLGNGCYSHNTSSQVHNATNGIEPPRGLVSVKASRDGVLKQVVPDIEELKDKYELLWDIPNNNGYLMICGILQVFVDQTISANTNYDPKRFPNEKISVKAMMMDMLNAYKWGVKTLYYANTRDHSGEESIDGGETPTSGCSGGGCSL